MYNHKVSLAILTKTGVLCDAGLFDLLCSSGTLGWTAIVNANTNRYPYRFNR